MADALILGGIAFDDFSTPDSMMGGGQQTLVVHKLPGGARVIDTLGPDEAEVAWRGQFFGNDAYGNALALDAMRAAGQVVPLIWGGQFRSVIIQQFIYHVRRLPAQPRSNTKSPARSTRTSMLGGLTAGDGVDRRPAERRSRQRRSAALYRRRCLPDAGEAGVALIPARQRPVTTELADLQAATAACRTADSIGLARHDHGAAAQRRATRRRYRRRDGHDRRRARYLGGAGRSGADPHRRPRPADQRRRSKRPRHHARLCGPQHLEPGSALAHGHRIRCQHDSSQDRTGQQ